jgi:phosphoribosyl-ATP pyrophosphohydrolase/phosphoribosyl-AMP cyclohydrolase
MPDQDQAPHRHAVVQDRLTGAVLAVLPSDSPDLKRALDDGEFPLGGRRVRVSGLTEGRGGFALVSVDDRLPSDGNQPETGTPPPDTAAREAAGPFLLQLEQVIKARQASSADQSYTRSLLDGGAEKIGRKLREEAGELAEALASETDARVASEAADVIFHLLVGLRLRKLELRSVIEVLARRFGVSGHVEKASRHPPQ